MASQVSDSKFVERNVVDPSGIVQVYKNFWWWCIDGDPKRAIFYRLTPRSTGSPQCNSNESIARGVGEKLGYPEGAQLIHIPLAFVPWET